MALIEEQEAEAARWALAGYQMKPFTGDGYAEDSFALLHCNQYLCGVVNVQYILRSSVPVYSIKSASTSQFVQVLPRRQFATVKEAAEYVFTEHAKQFGPTPPTV